MSRRPEPAAAAQAPRLTPTARAYLLALRREYSVQPYDHWECKALNLFVELGYATKSYTNAGRDPLIGPRGVLTPAGVARADAEDPQARFGGAAERMAAMSGKKTW